MFDTVVFVLVAFIFICVVMWALWRKEETVEFPPIDLEKISNPILPKIDPADFAEPGISTFAPEDPDPLL